MNKNNVLEFRAPGEIRDPLTKLLQQGTRQQIQQAIEAKLALQADSGESAPPSLQQLLMLLGQLPANRSALLRHTQLC